MYKIAVFWQSISIFSVKLRIAFFESLEEDCELFLWEEAGRESKMVAAYRLSESAPCGDCGSSSLLYLFTVELVHWQAQMLGCLDRMPGEANGRVEVHVSVEVRTLDPLHLPQGVRQHASSAFD